MIDTIRLRILLVALSGWVTIKVVNVVGGPKRLRSGREAHVCE